MTLRTKICEKCTQGRTLEQLGEVGLQLCVIFNFFSEARVMYMSDTLTDF